MIYFAVKNYEKFQHYKDRSPPWIKLYNDLLDNYEFGCLQDASKLHLILIWLLASRHDNRLPWDANWIAKRIGATEPVDLDALQRAGFISKLPSEQDASEALAVRKQTACLETEGETETDDAGASKVLSFWDVGVSLGIQRATIGRFLKDHSEEEVSDGIRKISLMSKRPADPTQYLKGILRKNKNADIYEKA